MTCCSQEASPRHPQSPGAVDDQEAIALVLLDPDQWQKNDFSASAFQKSKLQSGDLSVVRPGHTSSAIVDECVLQPLLMRNASRTFVGVLTANVADIRAIRTAHDERIFCIHDDPLFPDDSPQEFLGHALLAFSDCTKVAKFWERNQRQAYMSQLTRAFKKSLPPKTLTQVFDHVQG